MRREQAQQWEWGPQCSWWAGNKNIQLKWLVRLRRLQQILRFGLETQTHKLVRSFAFSRPKAPAPHRLCARLLTLDLHSHICPSFLCCVLQPRTGSTGIWHQIGSAGIRIFLPMSCDPPSGRGGAVAAAGVGVGVGVGGVDCGDLWISSIDTVTVRRSSKMTFFWFFFNCASIVKIL